MTSFGSLFRALPMTLWRWNFAGRMSRHCFNFSQTFSQIGPQSPEILIFLLGAQKIRPSRLAARSDQWGWFITDSTVSALRDWCLDINRTISLNQLSFSSGFSCWSLRILLTNVVVLGWESDLIDWAVSVSISCTSLWLQVAQKSSEKCNNPAK